MPRAKREAEDERFSQPVASSEARGQKGDSGSPIIMSGASGFKRGSNPQLPRAKREAKTESDPRKISQDSEFYSCVGIKNHMILKAPVLTVNKPRRTIQFISIFHRLGTV